MRTIAREGSKYTGYRDAALIAKDIRADIKAAKSAGEIPADVKVSVRCEKYSGGQSVRVTLSGWEPERVRDGEGYLTWEADMVRRRIEAMREAYNRDASDPMTDYYDVTYYGSTDWDWRIR